MSVPSDSVSHISGAEALGELDRVRLQKPVLSGGILVSAGAVGTIVHRFQSGAAFEVEFIFPTHAVVTVTRDQITSDA